MPAFADFEALSFDCYGTLIDWESRHRRGAGAVGRASRASTCADEELLLAYADHEARRRAGAPRRPLYPEVLAEAFRRTGASARSRR